MSKTKVIKTQKSTITLKQVWDALVAHGFSCEKPEDQTDREFRSSRRRDGRSAMSKFGSNADISRLGRAVTFYGEHVQTGRAASFELRLVYGTLGHGEVAALKQKTGIDLFREVADPLGEQVRKEPELVRQRGVRRDRDQSRDFV
ncbi:MAG: hypothetical protein RBR86_01890 [Pseudobdellovibrionaceae bacterium]|jgi:hypothetical protein|nr:hypothetical protein [Pseudobdellovibrionaceae bacterium]